MFARLLLHVAFESYATLQKEERQLESENTGNVAQRRRAVIVCKEAAVQRLLDIQVCFYYYFCASFFFRFLLIFISFVVCNNSF